MNTQPIYELSENPTVEQIRQALRPMVSVLNPTEYPKLVDQYGDGYHFPANAIVPIPDKMRYKTVHDVNKRSPSNATLWHNPKDHPRDRTADVMLDVEAAIIAAEICSPSRYGRIGFTVLLGNEHDAARSFSGRRRWLTFRLAEAKETELGIQRMVMAWQSVHPGTFPRMTAVQIEALAWLERYEAGEFEIQAEEAQSQREAQEMFLRRNRAISALQGPEAQQSVVTRQGKSAATAVVEELDKELAREVELPKPGEPDSSGLSAKEELDPAIYLFGQAKDLGLNLTASDMKGLLAGDVKAVGRVATQVKRARTAHEQKLEKGAVA